MVSNASRTFVDGLCASCRELARKVAPQGGSIYIPRYGHHTSVDPLRVRRLLAKGLSPNEIAARVGVTSRWVYRLISEGRA